MSTATLTTEDVHARAKKRFDKAWMIKSEMDSLDSLEIVVMIQNLFGVSISDDDAGAFGSINALVDFIEAHEEK